MPIIEMKNVNKSYGRKTVLNNISIAIDSGEFVAITGASGSGKSTLMNIIGLIEKADNGSVIIDGKSNISPNTPASAQILRSKINYLFQNFALIDEESVFNNLIIALKYVKASKKEKLLKIKEALKEVDLEGYEKNKIYELSGGEQQRVAIARIILKPGEIILADEPTGSLDENNSKKVLDLLKILNKNGKTVVIVTHDKSIANDCDRIINL